MLKLIVNFLIQTLTLGGSCKLCI